MKINEVPQEKNSTLSGVRKAVYAVQEDGSYTAVASKGWGVEEIVTRQAVEEYERLAKLALVDVEKERVSPLVYHMHKNRMDLLLLSQTTGFFKWTIRRDFKIDVFSKMSTKRLQVYADVMGIDIDSLLSIPSNN